MKNKLGIYIHIPFCAHKCPYCDFVSYTDKNKLMGAYASAIVKQMSGYATVVGDDYEVDSIYIGGGTPTVMPMPILEKILEGVYTFFDVTDDAEITCEANPASALEDTLVSLYEMGVNRISFGLQSADDSELRGLGRIHTYDDFLKSFSAARKAGFENISVDLMYGIPMQTVESFSDTIDKVIALGPEHVSAYGLKIEDGTPFEALRDSDIIADDDTQMDMYVLVNEKLGAAGINRYEISNFARPGFESRHNLKYWNAQEYLGFGCAAHSYLKRKRFANISDIDAYISGIETGGQIISEVNDVTDDDLLNEYVMLKLRLTEGIDEDEFLEKFGYGFDTAFAEQIIRFTQSGHMKYENGRYFLTLSGLAISNYILCEFLRF